MNDDFILDWGPPAKHPPRKYTKPTPSAVKVMEYYAAICRAEKLNQFRQSLDTIAKETGLSRRAVWNANDCLKQLGYLIWNRGGGNGPGQPCFPNVYLVNPSVFGQPGWEK
jgi:hypothetical protein